MRDNSVDSPARSVLWVVAALALLGAVLSGYMWYASLQLRAHGMQAGLPICPETDLVNCKEVLLSPYAQWMRIPVASAGVLNYAALLVVSLVLRSARSAGARRSLWTMALALAALGTVAGFYLLWVQLFRLHTICYLCDIVHACGLIALVLLARSRPAGVGSAAWSAAGAISAASLVVLIVGQSYGWPEARIDSVVIAKPPAAQTQSAQASATQTQPASSRPANAYVIRDAAGSEAAVLDLDEAVILGDPKAERTLIMMLDFGCTQCKREFEMLDEIRGKNPHWFRMICLFFPASKNCNAYTQQERPHVCEAAEAALAMRKHKPALYERTQQTFYRMQSNLTGGLAWQVVRTIAEIDDATLETWQKDPTWAQTIKRHCDIVHVIKTKPGLPAMYANGQLSVGADYSVESLEKKITQMIGSADGSIPPSLLAPTTTPVSGPAIDAAAGH